jgi:hypothetical protein
MERLPGNVESASWDTSCAGCEGVVGNPWQDIEANGSAAASAAVRATAVGRTAILVEELMASVATFVVSGTEMIAPSLKRDSHPAATTAARIVDSTRSTDPDVEGAARTLSPRSGRPVPSSALPSPARRRTGMLRRIRGTRRRAPDADQGAERHRAPVAPRGARRCGRPETSVALRR